MCGKVYASLWNERLRRWRRCLAGCRGRVAQTSCEIPGSACRSLQCLPAQIQSQGLKFQSLRLDFQSLGLKFQSLGLKFQSLGLKDRGAEWCLFSLEKEKPAVRNHFGRLASLKKITLYLRGYLLPASGESRWPERFRAPDRRNLHRMLGRGLALFLAPNLAAVVLLAGVGLAGIERIFVVYIQRASEDGLLSVEVDNGLRGCDI